MGNKMACQLVIILFGVVGISLLAYADPTIRYNRPATDNAPVYVAPAVMAPIKGMPEMLRTAGFLKFPAETSEEIVSLKSFPSGMLIIHQQVGRVVYCFVEPSSRTSNTLYMGNYSAYRSLQDLLEKRRQEIKKKMREGRMSPGKASEEIQGNEIKEMTVVSDQGFWNIWGKRYFGY